MIKKVFFLPFLILIFLFLIVSHVRAQSGSYIDSAYLFVNNDSNNVRFSSQSINDVVYFDEKNYYLKKDPTKQISDYRIVVKFNQTELNKFGGGIGNVSKVSVSYVVKDCPWVNPLYGAIGKYEGALPTSTFTVELGQVKTSSLSCVEDLLKKSGIITVTLTLFSSSGAQSVSTKQFKLNLQQRPINKCVIVIKTTKEESPKNLYNTDRLIVSGDKIDDGGATADGSGFKILLDGKEFPYCANAGRSTDCYYQNGNSFTISETQQSVGKHSILVQQNKENGAVLCSKAFTINAEGEISPAPAFSATDSGDESDKYINLSVSTPTSLCDAVPDEFKGKCVACAGSGENAKIWTALGCFPTNVTDLAKTVFNLFSGLLGLFIFYCIISNGLKVMISRDSADAMKKAQEAITSCIVGLLVLVFSVLFLRIVGVDILKLPGWS